MNLGWETSLYHFANGQMDASWQAWDDGNITKSWGHTLPARLAHVANSIVNLVVVPFAAIRVIFSLLHGLVTQSTRMLGPSWKYFVDRTDNFYLGIIGSVASPALVHWYQKEKEAPAHKRWLNINITYVVGTVRGAIYLGGALYYLL